MTTKALTAWQELNDRQQGTLSVIYDLEQQVDIMRKMEAAKGYWDNRPAAVWRRINFSHDPSDRRLFGTTELQTRLASRGWDNQGNGSTMAALADRGLITLDQYGTTYGRMRTVTLTRAGRAAARAGTCVNTGPARKAALGQRAWEVLAMLWTCDQAGKPLDWSHSPTIDRALIGTHAPPLARTLGVRGYEITDQGRAFYREHHVAHTAAHPDVHAPHPDGPDAEPWPPGADDILTQHRRHYRALCAAWHAALDAQHTAEKESSAAPPAPDPNLPVEVAELVAVRHAVWQDTARQRAHLAADHATDIQQRGARAARSYAAAALTVFHAAITGANPCEGLNPPGRDDTWTEPGLTPPAETGIPAIDTETKKRHATAVGAPLRRRGPAPTPHRGRRAARPDPPPPGHDFAALADFLRDHTYDGALFRRLHPGGTTTSGGQ
jgi:hypothetical protein